MDPVHIAAALLSAILHAGWNAVVKASPRPTDAMTAQMVMSALLVLPGLAWSGLPPPAAWPWIAASTSINMITVRALLKAYEVSGFGIAYPLVRALSVLLVVLFAILLSQEALRPLGIAGVGLIAASLLLLAMDRRGGQCINPAAFGWIAVAGVTTAAYVIADARGVRAAGSPWAYGFVVCLTNALAMGVRQKIWRKPMRTLADHAATALPVAMASVTSYLLILWVWSGAPIAPSAALRDTSAAFAIIIAIVWLREPWTRLQVLAILLAASAVPLLRFV